MAGITYVGSSWTTTAGNKTVAVTPAVGDLLLVFCGNSGRGAANPPTVTISVQGITFTRHATGYTKNTSADSGWVFVSDSLCTVASASTVTMTQSGDTGGGLHVFRVSGMTRSGLAAIRQVGKQDNAAAGTPSITMGAACLTGNPCFGMVHNGTNSTTTTAPPTSWSADHFDNGYTTPANGTECTSRASGNTLTTIAWTAASASAFGSILVELDASVPDSGPLPDANEAQMRHLLAQ
jgi:hypothetical protein